MPDTPHSILKRVFGYTDFRGEQAEIIAEVLAGRDALVLMPTGGGKSLCYQIPALLRPGTAVVVSPLIALMQDQVDALRQLGVRAAFLNSSLMPDAVHAVETALRDGALDLLYVAPERLLTEPMLQLLDALELALFAIDEAHCVSQWGHDFRPEYIQLGALQQRWPQVPRIALTATADGPTRAEISARLGLDAARHFIASFDRPNIRYRVIEKSSPRQQLLDFLRAEHAGDAGIVYCLSRKRVEDTAAFLCEHAIPALPYHAGMSAEQRRAHQARFLREEGVVMVATIAFGMGIDKPDVRFVAHLDLPKSLESYYQETGRAGRDGRPADAWMTYGLNDVVMLRRFIDTSEAEERFKRVELHKLDSMLGYCESTACRRQVLLHYFGEPRAEPCGNCDTCLEPAETWDGTEAARKALSCIYRTGQRFGASYLTDVLRGKNHTRIHRFGHHQVSTFGIGKDLSDTQWKSVYRQLVAAGLVAVDIEGHGGLRLTERARPVLRGEQRLALRADREELRTAARAPRPDDAQLNTPEARTLWDALRAHRAELARAQNTPPYVIFSDETLRAMLAHRPRTSGDFARLSGVGQVKLARYGASFLEVLAEHETQHGRPADVQPLPARVASRASKGLSDTERHSLRLLRSGLSPEAIAAQRALKPSTIYGHLAQCIELGEVALEDVLTLDEELRARIERAFHELPPTHWLSLRQLHEAFEERLDFEPLRCVHSAWLAAQKGKT